MKFGFSFSPRILGFLLLLLAVYEVKAQAQFYFSPAVDTFSEGDGTVVAGYVKTNQVSAQAKSFTIVYQNGTASAPDIGNFSTMYISVPANTDSVPFSIFITDDYAVEFQEYANLVLRGVTSADSVETDSIYRLNIIDNELPPTFLYARLVDTVTENVGIFTLYLQCINPNDHPVTIDVTIPAANSTMTEWDDFIFWQHTPSYDTGTTWQGTDFHIIDDTIPEATEYAVVRLSNFGASNVPDIYYTLYVIDNDNPPQPMSISFEPPVNTTVWEDTVPLIPIYITAENNNNLGKSYPFQLYVDSTSSGDASDYQFVSNNFTAPPGISHDTAYIRIVNDVLVEDPEQLFVKIRYGNTNTTNADTVFTINILDTDSAQIGFLGAGFTHLENEGTVAVNLVTSCALPYSISIPVHYYNGSAVQGTDYIFNDTTIIFPAASADAQTVFITLLDNLFYTGTRQVNFRLGELSPQAGKQTTGVMQFSLFILDDDSLVSGIVAVSENNISAVPNPFSNRLVIRADKPIELLKVMNITGQTVYDLPGRSNRNSIEITTESWASGVYFIQLFSDEKWQSLKVIKSE